MQEEKEIKEKILTAIKALFNKDDFLLKNNVHERSISHRLGMYLQHLFPDWDVDCEYNKKGLKLKQLEGIAECDEQKKTDRIYPDIIIHKRNSSDNLVVIEIKSTSIYGVCDIKKLKLLTSDSGQYKYKLGFFIKFKIIEDIPSTCIEIYKNGLLDKKIFYKYSEQNNDPSPLEYSGNSSYKTFDISQLDQFGDELTDENDYGRQQEKYLEYDADEEIDRQEREILKTMYGYN